MKAHGGSSPRAWGILQPHQFGHRSARFIPTCVGNTRYGRHTPPRGTVHPHVRGEYQGLRRGRLFTSGSSPRAWGIQTARPVTNKRARFIPTCVGNTVVITTHYGRIPVHPHVRGEYLRPVPILTLVGGSSPRAWGIRGKRPPLPRLQRFIPTCVGNTVLPGDSFRHATVHPHVRGEYLALSALSLVVFGSSPRAWGIPPDGGSASRRSRFIPTCVGNTMIRTCLPAFPTVHPHVRGEYIYRVRALCRRTGSSPRAWGIPRSLARSQWEGRFIPTCVGNTLP